MRDIERKIEGQPDLQQACEPKLKRVKAFLAQKPDDKNKIYALHAPEVECIAKGKARTRYEFGVKSVHRRHQRARQRRPVHSRHPHRSRTAL